MDGLVCIDTDQFVDWSKAEVGLPPRKKPVTLRLDADVLDSFKSLGKGYQTRINAVLRTYKRTAERPSPFGASPTASAVPLPSKMIVCLPCTVAVPGPS
ncbi:MAG: BrnA antitoxin family protein [Verrucomicrobia bacterium]|nr:BrnA antitoxin family protein [Verrucomicrobiota bacterium]